MGLVQRVVFCRFRGIAADKHPLEGSSQRREIADELRQLDRSRS